MFHLKIVAATLIMNHCFGALRHQSGRDAVRSELGVQGVCKLPFGGQLRSSAGAGHDPTDDAEGLFSQGVA